MNPAHFEELLQKLVGDPVGILYRLRWSHKTETWMIEQKVGRALFDGSFEPTDDEGLIRARDGYWLVMEVSPEPRVRCPECCLHITGLPALVPLSFQCKYCQQRGEHSLLQVCYFPLGDRLLDHMLKTSPKRDYQWQRGADARNGAINRIHDADRTRDRDNMMTEMAPDIMGIASSTHVQPSPAKYRLAH